MSNSFPQGSPGAFPTSYPSTVPAMARRSSYASVVSGTAITSPSVQQPARSGIFSYTGHQSSGPGSSLHNYPATFSQHHSRPLEMSYTNNSAHSTAEYWERGQLPQYSFPHLGDGLASSVMDSRSPEFFVPSYLRGAKHVERLEERYKARISAQRDGRSTRSSNAGSLSTSASSMNLHKMVPSHRGMTHDIIERPFTYQEEILAQLPSRWSATDKFSGLDILNDGLDVKFTGTSKTSDEAAAIRADHSIPRECCIYYFEVTVLGKGKEWYATNLNNVDKTDQDTV